MRNFFSAELSDGGEAAAEAHKQNQTHVSGFRLGTLRYSACCTVLETMCNQLCYRHLH